MDISWLTPALVRPHYFNGYCEGRLLSPIVRAREGEEEGGRGRAQLIYSNQRAISPTQVGPGHYYSIMSVNGKQCTAL